MHGLNRLGRISPSPFIKDVGMTAAASGLTVLSIVAVVRLLAQGLGAEGFGAYSLARQLVSTLMPFCTLAMSVSLARHVAMSDDKISGEAYLLSGLMAVALSGGFMLAAGLLFRGPLSALVFHGGTYSTLFSATLVMLAGYSLFSVLYGYYRGAGRMGAANLWQVGVTAAGPLAVAFLLAARGSVELVVFLMGALSLCALVPLARHACPAARREVRARQGGARLRDLLSYGLPRVPGGFAFAGILAVGPFIAPHIGTLKGAGYLLVGQSLFRVAEGGVEAFGTVALPKAARLLSDQKQAFLGERTGDIVALVLHMGLFWSLHLFVWSDVIVTAWLGEGYEEAVPLVRIMLPALVPYLWFVMLRSIVDAVQKKAINTINITASLAVTLAGSALFAWAGLGLAGLAAGTAVGMTTLGALTLRYLWKPCRLSVRAVMLKGCVAVNAALVLSSIVIRMLLCGSFSGLPLFIAAAAAEGLMFSAYCAALWKAKAWWMVELKNRVFV